MKFLLKDSIYEASTCDTRQYMKLPRETLVRWDNLEIGYSLHFPVKCYLEINWTKESVTVVCGLWKRIYLVLLVLTVNLLAVSYFLKRSKIKFILKYKFSIFADEQHIVISSASNVISDSFTSSQRLTTSLIKKLRSKILIRYQCMIIKLQIPS